MMSVAILVYCAIVACLAAWRLHYALALLIATLPLYIVRIDLGPLPSTLLELSIGVITLVWAWRYQIWHTDVWHDLKSHYLQLVPARALVIALGLLLVSATISIVTAPDTWKALGVWRAYFIEPALVGVVLLTVIRTTKEALPTVVGALISGIVIASIAIYQSQTGWQIPTPWLEERRATSIFPYPNAVGLYLAPLVPFAVAGWWYGVDHMKGIKKLLTSCAGASLAALLFVGIIAAKTEAAIVALALAASIMAIIYSARTRMTTLTLWGMGGIALCASPRLLAFVQEKLFLQDWSGHVRLTIWQETIPMLRDHWLTGAGLAGYQTVFAPYHYTHYVEIFLYPHNLIMNFWSEIGLYGLMSIMAILAVLAWMLVAILRTYTITPTLRACAIALLGSGLTIMIHGMVDAPYLKNDLAVQVWWFIVLVIILYTEAVRPNIQETDKKDSGQSPQSVLPL